MKKRILSTFSTAIASLGLFIGLVPSLASAETSQVIVTPGNTQGWSTADTRPGGAVNYINDTSAPDDPSNGALQLTTDTTTTAKAQYLHETDTALADVNDLSYYTKQNAPAGTVADTSYQLATFLNGGTSGFSTLVYEPYQNPTQGVIVNGVWQQWDVSNGLFWSTRTVTCSNGTILGTPGGPASYTLAQINAICPEALVAGFGVNVGTNNPGYDVETDLVNFNGTTYNFEPFATPSDKEACKDDGYKSLTDQDGQSFKNQGQCVAYANHTDGVGSDDTHVHGFSL